MKVKPPHYRLSLVWGLALLASAKSATADVNVSDAGTVLPAHHVRVRTPSIANEDRASVEERVFPTSAVDQAVRLELQPFAGNLISKDVMDVLHKQHFLVGDMRKFDKSFGVNAINELTQFSDEFFKNMVIWFGVKSPEQQEVVLDLLVAQLKDNALSRHNLLKFLEAGKASANDGFRMIAAAVEKKWLTGLSTYEMYDALGLPPIRGDEDFVRHVGHLIWEKFQILGDKEFTTFMLTKMRERSEDEIMWARLIHMLGKDETVTLPLAGIFDKLLQTKAVGAGNCRPFDAVKIVTSPQLLEVYNNVAWTSKEIGAAAVGELLEWSKDELMWAKLIYVLQSDKSVPTIPSSVFDHLLQPYEAIIFGEDQYTPSQAVKYLTGSEVSRNDGHIVTNINVNAKLLATLLTKSHDELMWAKVLSMLKNDKSVSAPLSDELTTLLHSWTEWPNSAAAIAEQTPISMSLDILMNPKFLYMYMYAHFASDKPDVFLLEKLRERSTNDIVWAQALNALLEDQSVLTPLSGVFDALLHSWIGKPYNVAMIADNQPTLIGAYKFLLNSAVTIQNRLTLPTPHEVRTLVNVLLDWSNDELMWAKFLYKLQQDHAFSVVAPSAFDTLLQLNVAAPPYSLSSMIKYMTSPSFIKTYKYVQSRDNVDRVFLIHLLENESPNQVMWAKVLYIMQSDDSESKPFLSNLLNSLLSYWTHDEAENIDLLHSFIAGQKYLEGQSFANLIAYARFLGDNPDAFVLEKLKERSPNEFMWARLLNKLRNDHLILQNEGHQLREEHGALHGVLNALLYSWIKKPYDAAVASRDEGILIGAYDYLTGQELANWYAIVKKLGQEKVDMTLLERLLTFSNDDVMWAKFLSKLKEDGGMEIHLTRVLQALFRTWKA